MEKQFSPDEYNEAIAYAIQILQSISPHSSIPKNYEDQEKLLRDAKISRIKSDYVSDLSSSLVVLDGVYDMLPYDDENIFSIKLATLRSDLRDLIEKMCDGL